MRVISLHHGWESLSLFHSPRLVTHDPLVHAITAQTGARHHAAGSPIIQNQPDTIMSNIGQLGSALRRQIRPQHWDMVTVSIDTNTGHIGVPLLLCVRFGRTAIWNRSCIPQSSPVHRSLHHSGVVKWGAVNSSRLYTVGFRVRHICNRRSRWLHCSGMLQSKEAHYSQSAILLGDTYMPFRAVTGRFAHLTGFASSIVQTRITADLTSTHAQTWQPADCSCCRSVCACAHSAFALLLWHWCFRLPL